MEEDNSELTNYQEKVNKVLDILTRPILGMTDEASIRDFINDYWQKYEIFTNEEIVPEVIWKSVSIGKKVIIEANNLDTPGAKIISTEFTKRLADSSRSAQNKGNTRVLNNPNIPKTTEENNNLDIAGFTNIAIILIVVLLIGIITAAFIFNR